MKTDSVLEIRASPIKVGGFAAFAVIGLVVPAIMLANRAAAGATEGNSNALLAMSIILVLAAASLLWMLVKKLLGGPVVKLSPEGFQHMRMSGGVVPWSAIKRVCVRRPHLVATMSLSLDPAFVKDFRGSRIYRMNRTVGFSDLEISNIDLAISMSDLLSATNAYRNAALARRKQSETVKIEPAPARRPFVTPFATIGLIAVLAAVFEAEVALAPLTRARRRSRRRPWRNTAASIAFSLWMGSGGVSLSDRFCTVVRATS